jgi:hypothetical protein
MLTTVEAEIDVNGSVTLLEPLTLTKKSRAIVTVLNGENLLPSELPMDSFITCNDNNDSNAATRQLDWLKANRNTYAGSYVALDGETLLAHAETLPEIRAQIQQHRNQNNIQNNIFIVKVFAEETTLPAGL